MQKAMATHYNHEIQIDFNFRLILTDPLKPIHGPQAKKERLPCESQSLQLSMRRQLNPMK